MNKKEKKKTEAFMRDIATALDTILNGENCESDKKKWGFALLVFPFGQEPEGRMNWISNGQREDMLVALKEFIARHEGRVIESDEVQ